LALVFPASNSVSQVHKPSLSRLFYHHPPSSLSFTSSTGFLILELSWKAEAGLPKRGWSTAQLFQRRSPSSKEDAWLWLASSNVPMVSMICFCEYALGFVIGASYFLCQFAPQPHQNPVSLQHRADSLHISAYFPVSERLKSMISIILSVEDDRPCFHLSLPHR
jgi:hypothetical protein